VGRGKKIGEDFGNGYHRYKRSIAKHSLGSPTKEITITTEIKGYIQRFVALVVWGDYLVMETFYPTKEITDRS
jgi:hypothetical protein